MSAPKVFISYSHDSPEHGKSVRGLNASLSRDGCDCRLDVFKNSDEDWPTWMMRQLTEADFVLCVATETYHRRFRDQELSDKGHGVGWEAVLIRRLLYAKKSHNDRIFPIFFDNSDKKHIPLELEGYDFFLLDGNAGYEALLRKLLNRKKYAKPVTGIPPNLGTTATPPSFARPGKAPMAKGIDFKADISRILKFAPADLIGRKVETKLLKDAWTKVREETRKRPRILTFVALGGEGKTSLVAKWTVDEMLAKGWPGCDCAFAWSFYRDGTDEKTSGSSDLFLKAALIFFGNVADKRFAISNASAFEKGKRLARIVGEKRSLLILDGLEPLQYSPASLTAGELKDQGIASLLKGLASDSHGLCVITTRYSLPDLKAFRKTTAHEKELLRLSIEAGVDLLWSLGVRKESGPKEEFEKLVKDVKGHALTLQIMGGFLKRAFNGNILCRDRVKFKKADEKVDGGHAFRTIEAYEQWLLSDGNQEGQREVAVLRLMGLFDRPADAGCLAALRGETIPGLTEPLTDLADEDWEFCIAGLEAAKLLTVNRDAAGRFASLDAHPHLRAYFAKQLSEKNPKVWCAGHKRLYKHLCATTQKDSHPTLEELQPLYQAVAHGCLAGKQREAFAKVYKLRLQRSHEYYPRRKLGALGSDLGALTCFFDRPWNRVSPLLKKADQAWVWNETAFCLRSLGRLTEAIEPMRATVDLLKRLNLWRRSAIAARNLSGLELTLGKVARALKASKQSVSYADRSCDRLERLMSGADLGDNLHQAGRFTEAKLEFQKAERIQAARQPTWPMLHSTVGFYYGDLLLALHERAAWKTICFGSATRTRSPAAVAVCRAHLLSVSQRMESLIKWRESRNWPKELNSIVGLALYRLILGRAALYTRILKLPVIDFRDPIVELDIAVSELRRSGFVNHLPNSLCSRALCAFTEALAHKFSRKKKEASLSFARARADLDEALEIAERGPMKLFIADIYLHRAGLFFREKKYPWKEAKNWKGERVTNRTAKDDLTDAEKLINICGYHRRDQELADAKRAILG